jgi:hypothetical protein
VVKVLLHGSLERDKLKIPMYLILVYDVGQKRVGKVCKTLRKHLNWVQNSVFEGEVSEADLRKIQMEIEPPKRVARFTVKKEFAQDTNGD